MRMQRLNIFAQTMACRSLQKLKYTDALLIIEIGDTRLGEFVSMSETSQA